MQRYSKYYKILKKQQIVFENIIDVIKNTKNSDDRLELAKIALRYATYSNNGYFTSSFLEAFFVHIGQSLKLDDYNKTYKKESFLHVLTTGYKVGGHTRVVERWIEYAPSNQTHSVVVLNPTDTLTQIEQQVTLKNGVCVYFKKNTNIKEKALNLRKLALDYEFIVLHTHMDDPVATIAFADENFKRPVIFYNHANHLFWIGKSVADIVLDILQNDEVTFKRRGIKNAVYLGIPPDNITFTNYDKLEYRKKLNLPLDKKIIITSGAEYKYVPICNDNFYNLVKDLIDNDTYLYAIGPTSNNPIWKKYKQLSNNHIIPLGVIGYHNGYLDYLRAGDLYIDSFPLSSWTAGIDAITNGLPLLNYNRVFSSQDYLKSLSANHKNTDTFIKMAKKILNNPKYAQQILLEEQKSLIETQSKDVWIKRLENILKSLPKFHKVQDLSNDIDYKKIDDYCVLINILQNFNKKNKYIIKLKYFIKYCIYKLINNKGKVYKYLLKLKF